MFTPESEIYAVEKRPASIFRIYEVARTVHLERMKDDLLSVLIYRRKSYDFHEELVDNTRTKMMGRISILRLLFALDGVLVELNEPLYFGTLLNTFLYTVALLAGRLCGRKNTIVVYAIENNDISCLLSNLPDFYRALKPIIRVIAKWTGAHIDRVVFGTEMAHSAYQRSGVLSRRVIQNIIPAVEPVCTSCSLVPKIQQVVFLGSLEDRKGINELMGAWEVVRRMCPCVKLIIAGRGPLQREVERWVKEMSDVSFVFSPSRPKIHSLLAESKVLVLLSKPEGLWKEQVGLPILEGLSHGCEIVTSSSTGIASWLSGAGHHVVSLPLQEAEISHAICSALSSSRDAKEIVDYLPEVSGRAAADVWLRGGG